MIKKIISGGQTGADQAALDIALKFNIDHGGWIPKGRLTEKGPLPLQYELLEMDTASYAGRTKKNIQESDGTLLISKGRLSGGSLLTKNLAGELEKPFCHIDLVRIEEFEAALIINSFLLENKIEILNVAGPRLSHCPGIYEDVKSILEVALYLMYLDKHEYNLKEQGIDFSELDINSQPFSTIEKAAGQIESDFSIRQKVFIARLEDSKIGLLYFELLDYIKYRFGLDTHEHFLLNRIHHNSDSKNMTVEDTVMKIIKCLKQSLEKNYTLKIIK